MALYIVKELLRVVLMWSSYRLTLRGVLANLRWGRLALQLLLCLAQPQVMFLGKRLAFVIRDQRLEVYYHINDFLLMLAVLRFFYHLGILIGLSYWRSDRAIRVW